MAVASPVWEGHGGWNGVKVDVWIGGVKGELSNPGSPGKMTVKPAYVCLLIIIVTIIKKVVLP